MHLSAMDQNDVSPVPAENATRYYRENRTNIQAMMIRRWAIGRRIVMLVALAMATMLSRSYAQSGAGSIQGSVTDSTGALLPGASIDVVNDATGARTDVVSNNAGFYQVPGLFTGQYTITITAAGMSTQQSKLQLLVAQNAVVNASLRPGAVTQQIEVKSNNVQLTTVDSGTISATLDRSRIDQLPENSREVLALTTLTTPGMEQTGTGGEMVNGLEGEAMTFVADGVPLDNRQFGGVNQTQSQLPDPDAVQEVQVETTNTSAQFSTPGATIITTRSGTNQFHGSFFETARNNAIGIAKNRSNPANYAAPHLVRNEFGASVGGPIIIPHLYNGKNKSFFFFAYERYSLSSASTAQVAVPTAAERAGNFSALTNTAGEYVQLYDPNTTTSSPNCNGTGKANLYCRTPFGNGILGDPGNNQIPLSRLSPTAKTLFDISPLPSNANNPEVTGSNLATTNPVYTVIPTISFRLDQHFNETNSAYLRFTNTEKTSIELRSNVRPATLAADGFPYAASGINSSPTSEDAAAIGYTHIFSPSFFAETIASEQWFRQFVYAGGTPTADFEAKLGLPNNFGEPGFPDIGSGELQGGNGGFDGTQFLYGLSQIALNFDENMTKIVGRHQIQFGGRYRFERFGDLPDQTSDDVLFNGQGTALENPSSGATYAATSNTGSTDADFFLGNVYEYSVTEEPKYTHFHDMEMDGYLQDNFHVSHALTLNLGLRWEDHPSPAIREKTFNSFDFATHAIVLQTTPQDLIARGYTTQAIITNLENIGVTFETPSQAGLPSTLLRNYPWNFMPRFAFAYQPFSGSHGTVLRGAYGRYVYPEPTRSYLKSPLANSPLTASYTQNWTSQNQTPDGLPNAQLRFPQSSGAWSQTSPFLPIMGVNSANTVNSSTTTGILPGVTNYSNSPDMPPDFVTQANVTVEQALKGNSALRVSWLLTHGSNLDHYFYYNSSPSTFVWEMMTDTAPNTANSSIATRPYDKKVWGPNVFDEKNGWSNDNALQVNYQRLFHRGIAYQVSYVFSKAQRFGGNWSRDGVVYAGADYLGAVPIANGTSYNTTGLNTAGGGAITTPVAPPPLPSGDQSWQDYKALDHYEEYIADTAVPRHHIRANGIIDLPFGRGKRYLSKVNRLTNEVVGGWQIAGDGQFVTQSFGVNTSNWGAINPIHLYKHGLNITDCQSTCQPAKLWFNGYIAPTASAMGKITGLPTGYAVNQPTSPAYASPINFTGSNGVITGSNNNVNIVGPSHTFSGIAFSPQSSGNGAHPYSRTILQGPKNYNIDLSIFKVFPITEKVFFRVNVDAFNAFNIQGYNNPNTTTGEVLHAPGGIGASSYWSPRQIQLTARLTF